MQKKFKVLIFIIMLILSIALPHGITLAESETNTGIAIATATTTATAPTGQNINNLYKAFKEVSYAYYMRGTNIQYNSAKVVQIGVVSYFQPEEATSQNTNYMVCSGLTRNIYNELLNIKIPTTTTDLLEYGNKYKGSPEVVAYAGKDKSNNNTFTLFLYDSKASNKIKKDTTPTLAEIIPILKVGDILTYTGHTILIYDLIKDSNGNVTDAYIIESGHGNGNYCAKTKIYAGLTINGVWFGSGKSNYYLFHNSRVNSTFGVTEGSIHITKLSTYSNWKNISTSSHKAEYSILRFIKENSEGKAVLKYQGKDYGDSNHNNELIILPSKTKSRIKYSKLYVEKTVNVHADSIVEPNNELKYTVKIENRSATDYTSTITLVENLSNYVTYKTNTVKYNTTSNSSKISFSDKSSSGELEWTIGELKKGDKVVITYTVKVKENTVGNVIKSTGKIANIPTGTVKNTIGRKLTTSQADSIKTKYNSLKSQYNGKKLINEIYKQALNVDLQLENFDITDLIRNTNTNGYTPSTLSLNKNNAFYKSVLNNYWSLLNEKKLKYKTEGDIIEYHLKGWEAYEDETRRADTIYEENFKTGDILIYKNKNDYIYGYNSNTDKITKTAVTYENGEYAYIYIEGKGFVGVNLGNDGKSGTKDDRNEFRLKYYTDNNLKVYSNENETNTEFLEFINYQTLFGKDYYVILRPALLMKGISIKTAPTKNTYIQNYETLNLTGGKLNISYVNGNTETIDLTNKEVSITGFSNTTVGEKTITVTYRGKSTTFKVNVVAKSLSGISVATNPSKNNYIQNYETLNLAGGKLKLVYNDASIEEKDMTASEVTTTGFDNSTIGEKTITVTYKGKSTTFKVNVVAKSLSSISVTTNPTKMDYIQNHEILNLAGGKLTLIYDDTSTEEKDMTIRGITTTGFNNSILGTNVVTIKFREKSTTLKVNIVLPVATKEYEVDLEHNIITEVPLDTKQETFIENIELAGEEYSIINNKGEKLTDTDYIGTGSKLKVRNEEYTLIVKGDLDGNGEITVTDVSKVKLHYIGLEEMEEPYLIAGQLTKPGELTLTDVSKIKLHFIGLESIK